MFSIMENEGKLSLRFFPFKQLTLLLTPTIHWEKSKIRKASSSAVCAPSKQGLLLTILRFLNHCLFHIRSGFRFFLTHLEGRFLKNLPFQSLEEILIPFLQGCQDAFQHTVEKAQ